MMKINTKFLTPWRFSLRKTMLLLTMFLGVTFAWQTMAQDYCTPTYTYGCSGDKISNVSLTGESNVIDNDSGCSENDFGDYTDLPPTSLVPGETYTLFVSTDYFSPSSEDVRAWIDYDNNGSFEDSEEIANTQGDGLPDGGTGEFEFMVPENADPGNYRMRVRLVYNGGNDIQPCENASHGETEDYTIEVIELEDCEGSITAGIAEDDFEVCPSIPFTISVSEASDPANGLVRQWQSSPAGEDDWTDIEDAHSSSYTISDGIEEPTDFRYKVVCNDDETDISNIISVTLKSGNECYCTPTYSTGCASGDQISNISLTGESSVIDNDSGCSENDFGDYTDLPPADLAAGETYTLSVSTDYSFPSSEDVRAWIDYNHNGIFEESEEIANTQGNGLTSGTEEFEFTVPETIDPGNYRMRVRLVYNNSDIQPCRNETYGETEDYMIEIIELGECEGLVNAGIVEDDFEVCAGNSFTISVSGASDLTNGLVRQWQSSPAGEDDWTDIEDAHSNNYTVSNGIEEPTDFRYKVVCNDDETDISDILSVTLKSAEECYCIPENNSSEMDYISNVSTEGALQNIDNSTEFSDNGYGDYTDSHVIIAYPGQEFNYSISANNTLMEYGIWLDMDNNGNFEGDLEHIANSNEPIEAPFTGSFEVPTDLEEGAYRLRVRVNWLDPIGPCEDHTNGETEDYTLQVMVPDCYPPVNIEIDYITDISAQVNWDINDEDSWVVVYGETGFDPETEGETIEVNGTPSANLIDLNDDTTYDVYVGTLCNESESLWNGPTKFTTIITPPINNYLCDALALDPNNGCIGGPYTNVGAFEETEEPIGSCLNQYHGTNSVWFTFNASADGEAVITTDFDSTEIQTEIVVYEAPTDCEDLTTLGQEVGCAGAAANGTLELGGLTPGETYYVKVGGFNSAEGLFCIEVQMDGAPVCLAPSDISIGDITHDTVEVSWTANGTATQWEVIYGETGFNPETEGESEVVNTTATILTGLTPETDYEVYVLAICSQNTSDLTGPEVFTTDDMSVDNQIFADFTFYPNPVKDQLTLKAGTTIEKVEVYNLLGQVILELQPNTLETNLNTEKLQSGVYLMSVTINGSQKTFRVVKK